MVVSKGFKLLHDSCLEIAEQYCSMALFKDNCGTGVKRQHWGWGGSPPFSLLCMIQRSNKMSAQQGTPCICMLCRLCRQHLDSEMLSKTTLYVVWLTAVQQLQLQLPSNPS